MIDLIALKSELQTDPNGYGYSAPLASGQTSLLADMLNEIRPTISIDRGLIPAHEIIEAIVPSEYAVLTDREERRINLIISAGQVNSRGTNTRAAFLAAFGAGTATRANLVALLTREGSRAEQLFDQSVSGEDVIKALEV